MRARAARYPDATVVGRFRFGGSRWRVNRAHPLARGLAALYDFVGPATTSNTSPSVNLVSGKPLPATTTGLAGHSGRVTNAAAAIAIQNDTGWFNSDDRETYMPASAHALSIMAIVANAVDDGTLGYMSIRDNGNATRVALLRAPGNGNQMRYDYSNVSVTSPDILSLNRARVVVTVTNGLSDHRIYVDGAEVAASTTTANTFATPLSRLLLGQTGSGDGTLAAYHQLAIWGRALGPEEVAWVSASPRAMLMME